MKSFEFESLGCNRPSGHFVPKILTDCPSLLQSSFCRSYVLTFMMNKAQFFYIGIYRELRHDGGSTVDDLFTARAQVASRRSRLVCG